MVQRSSTNSFGDLMIRYGIDDRFELRIFGVSYGTAPGGVEGWLDPSVGCKLRLYKRGGELTFVGQTTVPIGANPLRANEWNPTGKLAWSAPAGANTVGGNVVFSRMGSGSSRFTQSAASVYYSLPLTSKIALTNEFWVVDQVSKGGSGGSYASVAGTYLVNLDTQLDLRVGSSFNQRRDGWFIQAGISYRF